MLCNRLTRHESVSLYEDALRANQDEALRNLCLHDLFFLLVVAFKRPDINHPWLYDRCREVETDPDGYLDLWSREHYKSTIITFGKSIQDILRNPNETIGIFSHTRPIAKGFLDQIKRELESNTFLKRLFPDILYDEPKRQAERWSLDGGLIVNRTANPKEATFEAWGLVDSQPTSKHFNILVFDDVVTLDSVSNTEQIKKVTSAWEMALNLGVRDGGRIRYIGTRYHMNDTYKTIIERESATPRYHYPTTAGRKDTLESGVIKGDPVLLTGKQLLKKRSDMGPYTFSSQMLQNPTADRLQGFREEWLCFYDALRNTHAWNFYLLCDPANEKKKENDYTTMFVIALAPDKNYYLVDGLRDRLNLTERTKKIFEFHRQYRPLKVGYERYGMQADIQHISYVMEELNYRFNITELGGSMPKPDRIKRLVPAFEKRTFYLPHKLIFVDNEKRAQDLVRLFIQEEYLEFPVPTHDDMLDCASRIMDPNFKAVFPEEVALRVPSITMRTEPDKCETEYALF